MARRVVMGQMTNGSYDLRISRRGFDAMTADVNNDRQISFSAQRAARAKVGSAGSIAGLGNWVSFGRSYAYPPPVLASLKRSGRMIFNFNQYITLPDSNPGASMTGTPFCLMVEENRIRAIQPIPWPFAMPSGDNYLFYLLADD